MFSNDKKKLIIVYDKKTKEYAELLSALILMKDDKYDENGCLLKNGIVGVRDGSVDVALWDETTYSDNEPRLSSTTKIVFIGDGKIFKPIKANINVNSDISQFDIYLGYLANKAVIYVDCNRLVKDKKLYHSFIESFKTFITEEGANHSDVKQVERCIYIVDYNQKKANAIKEKWNNRIKMLNEKFLLKKDGVKKNAENCSCSSENNDIIPEITDEVAKGLEIAGHVLRFSVPVTFPVGLFYLGKQRLDSKKEMISQQFKYAVFYFYINKLAKFME